MAGWAPHTTPHPPSTSGRQGGANRGEQACSGRCPEQPPALHLRRRRQQPDCAPCVCLNLPHPFIHSLEIPRVRFFSRSGFVAGDCDVLLFLPNIKTPPGFLSPPQELRGRIRNCPYFIISSFAGSCPVRDKFGPSRLRSCSVRRHAGHHHRRTGRRPLLYVYRRGRHDMIRRCSKLGDTSALTRHSRQQLLGQGRCRSCAAPGAHAQCEADVRRAARILQR